MAAPARSHSTLAGPFGEADLEADQLGREASRCTYPPEGKSPAEPERESSIRELLEAPETAALRDTSPTPSTIEDALLRAAESQPRPAPRRTRPKS